MKKLVLLSVILIISITSFAGFVPRKDAEKAAKSHTYQSIGAFKQVNWDDLKMNCLFDPSENDTYNFYVFNIDGDQGYVIVSSDDKIKPILAYSFEGGFNHDNMAPAQKEFLKYFEDCISYVEANEYEVSEKITAEWEELISYYPGKAYQQKTTSPNLLENINWNQGWPYNAQCPADEEATYTNGHVPVGCVATAMLQVMKYYNWPPSGEGSKTYSYPSSWPYYWTYGTLSANFGTSTYDWYSIPNAASSYVNTELGKINYHAAVSVSMAFGPDGSGSQTDKIVTALETYFKYSTSCQYVSKSSYTETNWKNLIKAQIDAEKPVVYSGSSTTTGHAWNCDGYQDDSFHMNWGWGGAGNGYYTLDNLTSTATPGGPENNFNQGQDMVINIYPQSGYPGYCSGVKTITGTEGSFDDGSSTSDYQANQSCVYVIDPACGDVITISFPDFVLGDGDNVEIYDGDESSTTLLVAYDNSNLPGSATTVASGGAITVKFNTDGTSQAEGWNLSYSVKNCKTNMIHTAPTGTFNDGSGVCDYSNSSVCSWVIQPAGATYISLEFDDYEIAGSADFVKIYKDAQQSANLLYTFNSTTAPSGPINIPSGVAVVQFFADANNVGDGFTISYTSSTSDIESNMLMSNMSVMPNPGNLNSQLIFTLSGNSETKIYVTNMLGEVVAVKEYNLVDGVHEFNLGQIFDSEPQTGVYFINVDSGKEIKTQKFVVL
ncbi:MAG: C10 family peptidase [Bacteroidales bacterium]|nr:C10 family peptidase [Bacteroidales bacterium]